MFAKLINQLTCFCSSSAAEEEQLNEDNFDGESQENDYKGSVFARLNPNLFANSK